MIDKLQRNILLNSGKLTKEKEYWLQKLEGQFRFSLFPADRPLPAAWQYENEELTLNLPEDTSSRINTIAAGSDYAVFVILLAGVQYVLSRYTHQTDVAVGTPVFRASRQGAAVINTALPLRLTVDWSQSFKQLLAAAKQAVTEAVTHQNYPIESLAELLELPANDEGFPLMHTFVVYDAVHQTEYASNVPKNASFHFKKLDAGLSVTVSFNQTIYDRATFESVLNHLLAFYNEALLQPSEPLDKLVIWADSELAELASRVKRAGGAAAAERDQAGGGKRFHPLMRKFTEKSTQRWVLESDIRVADVWEMNEHCIQGHYIMPGTSYVEMAVFATQAYWQSAQVQLSDVQFHAPFILGTSDSDMRRLRTVIEREGDGLRFRAESTSGRAGADSHWTVHATCQAAQGGGERQQYVDIAAIGDRCGLRSERIGPGEANVHTAGFGPRWQGIERYDYGEQEALVSMSLDERFEGELAVYAVHPALLDLCTSSYVDDEHAYLPLGYKKVAVYAPLTGRLRSHLVKKPRSAAESGLQRYDIAIANSDGGLLVAIEDFTLRRVQDFTTAVRALSGMHSRLHRVVWTPWASEQGAASHAQPDEGAVLLLHGESERSRQLAQLYRDRGWQLIEVVAGARFERQEGDRYAIGDGAEDYVQLVEALAGRTLSRVVHFLAADQAAHASSLDELQRRQKQGVWSLFHTVRALERLKLPAAAQLPLHIVTCRAVHAADGDLPLPENAALLGLAKVIPEENRQLRVFGIDCDDSMTAAELLRELSLADRPVVTAYRHGQAYVEMLDSSDIAEGGNYAHPARAGGTYLITGGTGGLGLEAARFLAAKQPVTVALVSRSKFPARTEWEAIAAGGTDKQRLTVQTIQQLESRGSRVVLYDGDTADLARMSQIVEEVKLAFGPLRGVIHAAGVAGDGFIVRKDERVFGDVLRPKTEGTFVLDAVTAGEPLDFFVLFSSIATLGGAAGQGDYTAANSYLDAFAAYRSGQGRRTLAINWAGWKETGMAVDYGAQETFFAGLSTQAALDALGHALQSGRSRLVIGELNAAHPAYEQPHRLPLRFSAELLQRIEIARGSAEAAASQAAVSSQVKGAASELESQIGVVICGILGLDNIDAEDDFFDMGGHSILAIKLLVELEKLGLPADGLDVYQYSTARAMAAYLKEGGS